MAERQADLAPPGPARAWRTRCWLWPALLLAGCASAPEAVIAPAATAPVQRIEASPAAQAAVTAHPLATRTAMDILGRGGSAVDAAIAAQMVLGLVEAQSSGVGGGSLILYWDHASGRLTGHDGLAAAPLQTPLSLAQDVQGRPVRLAEVERGSRPVGVPGTLAVLKSLHERHGRLPWAELFAPAIRMAEDGFAMSRYMHGILSGPTAAHDHPDMGALYFGADGQVLPVGAMVRNPAYAATLRAVAQQGPRAPWAGAAGDAVMRALAQGPHPSYLAADDFRRYQAREREPVCAPFLAYRVCAMSPPSFGGVVVLQVLQMLEARAARDNGRPRLDFDDPGFVHLFSEAGRLAQADRQQHIGDPDFADVPVQALVAPAYVRQRAARVDLGRAAPGHPAGNPRAPVAAGPGGGSDAGAEGLPGATADATSQMAVVDAQGNALSMTTTINLNFGSRRMVGGYVLNNVLTNFSTAPRGPNRMEPGKRAVTSMAPVVVFDAAGRPMVVGGSAGGGQIVDYIAQSLVEMLANGRTPAQALSRGHVSTATGRLELEADTPAAAMAGALGGLGHEVRVGRLTSGLGFLKREGELWLGAADPRRDGVAEGR